jgi:hypothetical protein
MSELAGPGSKGGRAAYARCASLAGLSGHRSPALLLVLHAVGWAVVAQQSCLPPLLCSAEAELSRQQVVGLDLRTGSPLSLTQQGPAGVSGASNYWLDVHPPLTPGRQAEDGSGGGGPAARIWLLDSGDRTCPPLMFGWWAALRRGHPSSVLPPFPVAPVPLHTAPSCIAGTCEPCAALHATC